MKRAPDIFPIPLSGLTPIIQQGGRGRLLQALVSKLLLVPLILLLVVALLHNVVVVVVEVVVAAWEQGWFMG
jgi:membrane protein required for beta-lactamase induction